MTEDRSRVLTLVFSDLADSTALKTEHGDAAVGDMISRHRAHVTRLAGECSGRVIDWAGDGCFLTFETSSAGVMFALRLQQAHADESDLPGVRIGMHMGEITEKPGPGEAPRIEGLAVDIAARISSLATPGQILMSSAIYTSARQRLEVDALGEPVLWQIHGTYELKGFDHPLEISEAGFEGTSPLLPPPESEKCKPVSSGSHVDSATLLDWDAPTGNRWALPLAGVVIIALVAAVAYLIGTRETPIERAAEIQPAIEIAEPEPVAPLRAVRTLMSISDAPMAKMRFGEVGLALSPDGSNLVYVGQIEEKRLLVVRSMENHLETRALSGTEGAVAPFFSPDGEWIAFMQDNELKKVPAIGGNPIALTSMQFIAQGSWSIDGYIYYTPRLNEGVHRVPERGGTPELLTEMQPRDTAHIYPSLLPGGKALVYGAASSPRVSSGRVLVKPLDGGEEFTVATEGARALYVPTGHLLVTQTGRLIAQPFDLEGLGVIGEAGVVTEQFLAETDTAPVNVAVANNGTLVYAQGGSVASADMSAELVWVDREGNEETLSAPLRGYYSPRISPDGKRIVAALLAEGESTNVWVLDIERRTLSKATRDTVGSTTPNWLPDGRIVFSSSRAGEGFHLFAMDPDALEPEVEQLTSGPGLRFAANPARDSSAIFFSLQTPQNNFDIAVIDTALGTESEVLISTPAAEGNAVLSPNGNWLAYASAESGASHVFIVDYPEMQSKIQISSESGREPAWATDGSEVYFRDDRKMLAVAIDDVDGELLVGSPEFLFDYVYLTDNLQGRMYDVSPTDGRFLMMRRPNVGADSRGITELVVVTNWFEDLKKDAPYPDAK